MRSRRSGTPGPRRPPPRHRRTTTPQRPNRGRFARVLAYRLVIGSTMPPPCRCQEAPSRCTMTAHPPNRKGGVAGEPDDRVQRLLDPGLLAPPGAVLQPMDRAAVAHDQCALGAIAPDPPTTRRSDRRRWSEPAARPVVRRGRGRRGTVAATAGYRSTMRRFDRLVAPVRELQSCVLFQACCPHQPSCPRKPSTVASHTAVVEGTRVLSPRHAVLGTLRSRQPRINE